MNTRDIKKEYRTVGLTVFIISVALLVMRIVTYYVQVATIDHTMTEYWYDLLIDAIFSVPVQIGILFVFPFLMYKLRLKKSARDVFEFSGFRKCNVSVILLSFALGALVIILSIAVSYLWQIILVLFGYNLSSSDSAMPERFNALYFVLSVLLTAVLPGICEEFTNRGGLLTVLRATKSKRKTIILVAIAFGLFHQNITQTLYTAVLGGLLAYLVLETGSIYPAMIVHFMNNFTSVYLESATEYGWAVGGGFYDYIYDQIGGFSFGVLTSWLALALLAIFGLVVAIVAVSRKTRKIDYYLELNYNFASSEKSVSLKDNAFFIGAIVVTGVATFITYVFGL